MLAGWCVVLCMFDVMLLKYIQEWEILAGNRVELTHELHVIQAHLLHYQSLLHRFQLSVSFIENFDP